MKWSVLRSVVQTQRRKVDESEENVSYESNLYEIARVRIDQTSSNPDSHFESSRTLRHASAKPRAHARARAHAGCDGFALLALDEGIWRSGYLLHGVFPGACGLAVGQVYPEFDHAKSYGTSRDGTDDWK